MKVTIENININVTGNLSDDMTDEEFFHFCTQNRDLRIERDSNRQIYIMAPTGFETGGFNSDINAELNFWNRKNKNGKVFDSSTGFTLPDRAVFSPDAAWISNEKILTLTKEQRKIFAPVCPDFIIELKSKSDTIPELQNKMLKWIENGCALAWLLIPEKEEAHIYRGDGSIEIVKGFNKKLSGENILPGFQLDLSILK
jgi:Uma2 family endonuclease